jgi:hypothetical protein
MKSSMIPLYVLVAQQVLSHSVLIALYILSVLPLPCPPPCPPGCATGHVNTNYIIFLYVSFVAMLNAGRPLKQGVSPIPKVAPTV